MMSGFETNQELKIKKYADLNSYQEQCAEKMKKDRNDKIGEL